jgi:hypothetical protein
MPNPKVQSKEEFEAENNPVVESVKPDVKE